MTNEETVREFRRERDRHYESAKRSLARVKDEVLSALELLREDAEAGSISQTVGGSVLNSQYWQDAERSLVRYWDAAGVVAILEQEQDHEIPAATGTTAAVSHALLRDNKSYRVELNRPYGANPTRINWVEAISEDDAVAPFKDKVAKRKGVVIISVRVATEADLQEYLAAS